MKPTTNPENENSTDKPKSKGKVPRGIKLINVNDSFEFNTEVLDNFLGLVFHQEMGEDDNILTWRTATGRPAYPVADHKLLDTLDNSTQPAALYFGTSTCRPDPESGKLRNRKALFQKLHVVVFDDIGTKVQAEELPEGLEPTYIIESSEGNYQYGYVLDEPVDNLELAEALIQVVYESGYCDEGGKMPTKLVRLPDGINGKKGAKQFFPVTLTKDDGPLWSPSRLLEVLDLGITWEELSANTEEVLKKKSRKLGTSPWSPIRPTAARLDGTIDPVLEWLYEKDMVVQESNDWYTIKCPWSEGHTDGRDTAGYSPLGCGDGKYFNQRGFHCLHEHCTSHKTPDFLQFVAMADGPEAGVRDEVADIVAQFAYDCINDSVWDMKRESGPVQIPFQGFKNVKNKGVSYYDFKGEEKRVKEHALWAVNPARVVIEGRTSDPTNTAAIIESDGALKVNTFRMPSWGSGTYDQDDIDIFMAFVEYLIPNPDELKYYLDWLAAKVQNMGFRGCAILMIAPNQGTGRTTLSEMITTLMGVNNTARIAFDKLTGQYNEFLTKPMLFTDETLTGDGSTFYKAYEALKDLIDPLPKLTHINPKYGKQYEDRVYTSINLFSNHVGAMSIARDDRRFYVIQNTLIPAPPAMFVELHKWFAIKDADGRPKWAKNVFRWLSQRDVDVDFMNAPPPETQAKREMGEAVRSGVDTAVESVLNSWPVPVITKAQVMDILAPLEIRICPDASKNLAQQVTRSLKRRTTSMHIDTVVRVGTKSQRPKLINTAITEELVAKYVRVPSSKEIRQDLAAELRGINITEIREHVVNELDIADL